MSTDFSADNDILRLRWALEETVSHARTREDLFPAVSRPPGTLPSRGDKEAIWLVWQRVLDLTMGLDRLADRHSRWPLARGKGRREESLHLFSAAWLAQYRFALDFITLAERDPVMDAILNDRVPEAGLPAGTYDTYKFRFLSAARGTEFGLLAAVLAAVPSSADAELAAVLKDDTETLWLYGETEGPILTARNALAVLRKTAIRAWFPFQKQASLTLSHLRLPVRNGWNIKPRQARALIARLEPGDILLQRREWAFTNLGIPGFWTHAALYTGTADDRTPLASDPAVAAWAKELTGGEPLLEAALVSANAEAYSRYVNKKDENGAPFRVVEALAPGVVITSLERSTACDGMAVLRPRLPATAKAAAITRAFRYVGRPYDFSFDFAGDSALICSELVLKAYEGNNGLPGLRLPVRDVAGHRVVPANEFARVFDEEADGDFRQFDLVLFLDGDERDRRVVESDEAAFRESWRRPKWHVLTRPINRAAPDEL